MISYPGSTRQTAHPDTPYSPQTPLLTIFIALQDVEKGMGPTTFLPGSFGKKKHEQFREDHDGFLRKAETVEAELGVGDCR